MVSDIWEMLKNGVVILNFNSYLNKDFCLYLKVQLYMLLRINSVFTFQYLVRKRLQSKFLVKVV